MNSFLSNMRATFSAAFWLGIVGLASAQVETRFFPDPPAAMRAAASEMREVIVKRCDPPPVIDGALDDPAWQKANPQGDFRLLRLQAKKMLLAVIGSLDAELEGSLPAGRPVEMRLLYDDTYLYLGFDITEPNPAELRRTHQEDDVMLLWQDDTAEILLDPDCDRERYFHFMINANGCVTDGEFGPGIGRLDRAKWTCRWKCASRLPDGKWTVEIALPFQDMGRSAPVPGEVWLGNFGHNTYARFDRVLPNGMKVNANGEFAAWMTADRQIHELWNLGEIVFDRPPAIKIVSLDWSEPAWGMNVAEVALENKTGDTIEGNVAVVGVSPEPISVKLGPGESRTLHVPYVINAKGRSLGLTLQVKAGREVLASRQTEVVLPSGILVCTPREEILWSGDRHLPVDYALHVGSDALETLAIEIVVGETTLRIAPETRRGTLVLPVSPEGDIAVTARVLSEGKAVEEGTFIVRRMDGPMEWGARTGNAELGTGNDESPVTHP